MIIAWIAEYAIVLLRFDDYADSGWTPESASHNRSLVSPWCFAAEQNVNSVVYIRVAVECTGRFTHRGGLDVFRHQCLRCRRHLPSPRKGLRTFEMPLWERDSRSWPVALGAMLSNISIYSNHPMQTPHSIAPEGLVTWQLQSLDGFVGTIQRAWLLIWASSGYGTSGCQSVQTDGIILHQPWAMMVIVGFGLMITYFVSSVSINSIYDIVLRDHFPVIPTARDVDYTSRHSTFAFLADGRPFVGASSRRRGRIGCGHIERSIYWPSRRSTDQLSCSFVASCGFNAAPSLNSHPRLRSYYTTTYILVIHLMYC